MKKILLFSLLGLFLFYSSCKKEDAKGEATITMDFDFVYGDAPFVINQVYSYPLAYDLKIEALKLYVSNIKLTEDNGAVKELSTVVFIDSDNLTNAITAVIPEGNYTKIEFSIGVPQSLNGTDNPDFDAALYSPTSPLSLSNGMYWTWNTGYRFVLLDGRVNTNPSVDTDFETLLSIHTGKDYSFRTRSMNINVNAMNDASVSLVMKFDVEAFLAGADDVIDIAVDNQSHGTNESLANRMSDNVISSIVIE